MAMTEDFSVFFSADEFAVSASCAGVEISGIFDAPHERGNVGGMGMGMASVQPTFTLPTASVPPSVAGWFSAVADPSVPVNLDIIIASATYRIVAHEPDGTGLSVLVLERLS